MSAEAELTAARDLSATLRRVLNRSARCANRPLDRAEQDPQPCSASPFRNPLMFAEKWVFVRILLGMKTYRVVVSSGWVSDMPPVEVSAFAARIDRTRCCRLERVSWVHSRSVRAMAST